MKSSRLAWRRQRRALLQTLLLVYLPGLLVLGAAATQNQVPISDLVRDPVVVMKAPLYTGVLSTAGVLFWSFSTAICLFTWVALRGATGEGNWPAFFLASGVLSGALMLDDLLLFHEFIGPYYLYLPEKLIEGAYVVAALAYLVRFRAPILRTEFLLLLAALGFLAASLATDGVARILIDWGGPEVAEMEWLAEDGAKLLGIIGWFAYTARSCAGHLKGRLDSPETPAP